MPEARVLVVEDDQTLSAVIAEALVEDGYAVDVAGNGETALKMARRLAPDLVILDLMMPHMSGEEFSAAMRDIEGLQSTPLIIISASRYTEEVAGRVGARVALRKPFDLFELTRYVGLLLS